MTSTPTKRPAGDAGTPDPKRSKTKDSASKGDKESKGLTPEAELQMSLLNSDPELKAHFTETVLKNRPEGIKIKDMARQFWASRAHLLRAHAIQREQQRAQRYALSEKRMGPPKEGKVKVVMNHRQIADIFKQHPIVRKAFDELVPGRIRTAEDFWERFWVSHLCCALKGQRPDPDFTKKDSELDRYLSQYNASKQEAEESQQEDTVPPDEQRVPRFIDVEGNEQNHSQRKGNAPDISMRAKETREGTIRILNTMSERILAASAPADPMNSAKDNRAEKGKQHTPAGLDEATYQQLRLRDLQAKAADDRVKLSIRDPNQIHASGAAKNDARASTEAQAYLSIDPAKALSILQDDMIARLLEQQQHLLAPPGETDSTIQSALAPSTAQNLALVHHTTTEFLHYFWTLLLAAQQPPPPAAAKELAALLASLSNSLARIAAVADDAQRDRDARLATAKREAAELVQRSEAHPRVQALESIRIGRGLLLILEFAETLCRAWRRYIALD
ncbi:hypothetical protein FH972_021121 [Carpinus fangiana]|uniref:BSD domain-containing protein n=1 Tax=Carpinus fangiana TaxID=176857 RepID=A0A5N6KNE7_9ROSI|nr:hypothetical protein FH972_021121 [Carpinus fangiana]